MISQIRKNKTSVSSTIYLIIKNKKIACYAEIKKELEMPVYSIFLSKPAIYYHINKLIEQEKIKISEIKRDKKIKNNIPVSYFCIQTGNIAGKKLTPKK